MQKMNVIAKISCYLDRSVVTLKLRKEYLNTVTHNASVLLRKNWTVWCIERYSMSTYTWVTNCRKTVRFLAHHVLSMETRKDLEHFNICARGFAAANAPPLFHGLGTITR